MLEVDDEVDHAFGRVGETLHGEGRAVGELKVQFMLPPRRMDFCQTRGVAVVFGK
jgi:hypothetical protein